MTKTQRVKQDSTVGFQMDRRKFLSVCGAATVSLSTSGLSVAEVDSNKRKPNILWITCEDISPILGCNGDQYAVTPNLDKLAAEGVLYTHAFSAASVCTPSRSCLITGVYPNSLGTQHLRSLCQPPEYIKPFPYYLRQAGYYCSNNVKEDYNFVTPKGTWDECSGKAHWRNRKAGQPFFSVFNFVVTHQSRTVKAPEEVRQMAKQEGIEVSHDPEDAPIPPYYPDTPAMRERMAVLYDLVTIMDTQAGRILKQLEEDGLADDTIVFFYSDHGNGMPRHKRWLYDSGTRVPLIIRFPKKYRALAAGAKGTRNDRLVSFVDLAPSIFSLLGLEIPGYMQGSAFLGPKADPPRKYLFFVRDRVDEVYDCNRSIRDRRYRYVRNYMPHRPYMPFNDQWDRACVRQALHQAKAEGQLPPAAEHFMSSRKDTEELFDTQNDPYEVHNLIDSPAHQKILARLRSRLQTWILETHDTGLLAEGEMHLRADKENLTIYEMAKKPDLFDVSKIFNTAELVGRGPSKLPKLIAGLDDVDPGVRWWSCIGLICLGSEAKPALDALHRRLDDSSPSVRFSAAEALCQLGEKDRPLKVLIQGLEYEKDMRNRLYAAITLQLLGETARPAASAMKRVLKPPTNAEINNEALYVNVCLYWTLHSALSRLGIEPEKK